MVDPKALLGERAPAIEGVELDGEEVSVNELPKPHLLVFLRIGCSTCWEALVPLSDLSSKVSVVLIAVSSTEEGIADSDRERLGQLRQEMTDGRASILVAHGAAILRDYGLATSPTFCLVDNQGLIAGVWEGQLDRAALLERLPAVSPDVEGE